MSKLTTLQDLLCQPLMLDPRALPGLIDEMRIRFDKQAGATVNVSVADIIEPTVQVEFFDHDGAKVAAASLSGEDHPAGSLVAVVPIKGVVTRHGYSGWFSSAPGTLDLTRHIQALDRDPAVGAIILDVNSPGGQVSGTPEMAEAVYEIRKAGRTKVVASVDPLMASAATYIATAAEEVYAIGSADVGSVGVIASYSDYSAYLEKIGIKVEYFRVPEKKARFTSYEPMDDDMRATVREGIEETYEQFVADLARNRGVSEKHVRDKFGGGEVMSAAKGVDCKMIDGIKSLDQVVSELVSVAATSRRKQRRQMAGSEIERALAQQQELEKSIVSGEQTSSSPTSESAAS